MHLASILATCILPLAATAEMADAPELGFMTAPAFLRRQRGGGCDPARGQTTCADAGCCVSGAVCTTQSGVPQCVCPAGSAARCACPRDANTCVHDHITVCCPQSQVCDRVSPGFCKTRALPASSSPTTTNKGGGGGGGGGSGPTAAPSSTFTDTVAPTDTATSDVFPTDSTSTGSTQDSQRSTATGGSGTGSPTPSRPSAGSSFGDAHPGILLLAGFGIVLALLVV